MSLLAAMRSLFVLGITVPGILATATVSKIGETIGHEALQKQGTQGAMLQPVHRGLAKGVQVLLHGLHSAVSLNGHVGSIMGFDPSSHRYAVHLSSGQSMKIRPSNLWLLPQKQLNGRRPRPQLRATGAEDAAGATQGALVILRGLVHAKELNGRMGRLQAFDSRTQRYIVKLKDGVPRRVKPSNLYLLPRQSPRSMATSSHTLNHKTDVQQQPLQVVDAHDGNMVAHKADVQQQPLQVVVPAPAGKMVENNSGANQSKQIQRQAMGTLRIGSRARLCGLHAAAHLNGQMTLVRGYDAVARRYIVQLASGELKRVKGSHLAPVHLAGTVQPRPREGMVISMPPMLCVCNAYTASEPLQVFALLQGVRMRRGQRYAQVIKDLEFQTCRDLQTLPPGATGLAFISGRLQVGRMVLGRNQPRNGVEVTIFRADKNTLKATIREDRIERADPGAYYLHVVNGYAGSKTLGLVIERGAYRQSLPMDKTYKLTQEQLIGLTLTDGSHNLQLSFQPRRSRSYCIIATGAEAGVRGVPRNMGIVAHELGTWTTSEESGQEDQDSNPEQASAPTLPVDSSALSTPHPTTGANSPQSDKAAQLVQWFADTAMWPR
mmetsp:Transcript_118956/g.237111  ORF Transcript_118956/g.237111 Transcript_118956/m.237111 type:complete len:605 (+) Transcript_118956:133-1947(+)|eukprot:CAMPEP_0172722334 /NCGR_PEP_ID=MMETSP1074-20121228/81238_1 /TAXON_ID=2916 /ORGANISM="Ceratium fusus, Strain PA161109" /LENGTH=604 /DNA_ID=CAMNT_0013548315 /DNA_START=88 /DNA_END=1902 /DNA_ORIENTATION=+